MSKNPSYKFSTHHSLKIDPKSIVELDKWNSQQISLARKHFVKGLTANAKTLDAKNFETVFPLIKSLPKVTYKFTSRR